jgi:alpha-amylase
MIRQMSLRLLFATIFAIVLAEQVIRFDDRLDARRESSEWMKRSIYQVITDRFSRNNNDSSACGNLRRYCGGTYDGIIDRLDDIQHMGFDAIWISPIPHNGDLPDDPKNGWWGDGYHGYWADDWSQLNPHFGTPQDLVRLISECHKRGIWVMLDVVANHGMPIPLDPQQKNEKPANPYATLATFNKLEHYNHFQKSKEARSPGTAWDHCIAGDGCFMGVESCLADKNISQQDIQVCWSGDLADLNQNHPFVRKTLTDWIRSIIEKFGFDGIRVDTQPYVDNVFWGEYRAAAGVFAIGESTTANVSYLSSRQSYPVGLDSALSYPLYYAITDAFGSGTDFFAPGENSPGAESAIAGPHGGAAPRRSLRRVAEVWEEYRAKMPNPAVLGNFVDNHDQPRFLWYQPDIVLLRNALVLIFMSPGIPIVYYGTELGFTGKVHASQCDTATNDAGYPASGGDPCNRQPFWMPDLGEVNATGMTSFLRDLNKARREITDLHEWPKMIFVSDVLMAFSRGGLLVLLTNTAKKTHFNPLCLKATSLPFKVGAHVHNLLNKQQQWMVSGSGLCLPVSEPLILADAVGGPRVPTPMVV